MRNGVRGDCDRDEFCVTLGHCLEYRGELGADCEPVGGVLHVAACVVDTKYTIKVHYESKVNKVQSTKNGYL